MPLAHVQYEELVREPERHLERVFAYLGVEHEPEAVTYGRRFEAKTDGPGDPIGVGKHDRPVTGSIEKWAAELASDARKLALARQMIDRVAPEDLAIWGTTHDTALAPV